MTEPARHEKLVKLRLALFFFVCLAPIPAFLAWRWYGKRPAPHELCVAQAEHRLDLMFGSRLAEEAEEHPRDYEKLRTSMIATCEGYWTRAYAQCLKDAPSLLAVEDCEKIGRSATSASFRRERRRRVGCRSRTASAVYRRRP